MKAKFTALFLSLLTSVFAVLAQENSPPPGPEPVPPPEAIPPAPPESPPANLPETPPAPGPDAPLAPPPTPPSTWEGAPGTSPATETVPAPPLVAPVLPGLTIPPTINTAPPALPDNNGAPPQTDALPVRAAEARPPQGEAGANAGDEVVPLIVIDDVPLPDAIRNLARQSNLNFIFDPRITATNQPNISIRFENVTAMNALLAVLENYGLALVQEPKTKIARVTIKDPQAEDPLFVKVIELKYSDPTNLVEVIKPTLSPRSRVLADQRTRQLIVTTTEKELEGLATLIEKLDTQTKQVLIEARILETAKNPTTIKGINWSGTLEAQNFQFGNGSTYQLEPTAPTITPNPLTGVPTVTPGYGGLRSGVLGAPRLLANTGSGFSPATAFLNADGVSAVLSFLNKDSDTEVIATPRAVTLDNQTAQLSVTRAFPIFQITPGSANSPAGSTIIYTNLGTILSVTPRIAADNNISMRVVPEVSNIDGKDQQTINGAPNIANIYAIRRIETHVMIPSGHTLVMGGLINDSSTKAYTKVPLLGDIPLVGMAFRHQAKERKKQNLVVFITPTIIAEQDFHLSASGSEFLQTRYVERPEVSQNAWDSAKPHDWTKPVP